MKNILLLSFAFINLTTNTSSAHFYKTYNSYVHLASQTGTRSINCEKIQDIEKKIECIIHQGRRDPKPIDSLVPPLPPPLTSRPTSKPFLPR